MKPDSLLRDRRITPFIAQQLSEITGRLVIDRVGLTDRYDVKLEWAGRM